FVDELEKELAGDLRLEICRSTEKWELGVLVCGCPAACADGPETRSPAQDWILVTGPAVDMESMPENEMARVVALKIKKYFERRHFHEVE
ncbi:MAG: hypothetical protein ABSG91_06040, partial [Syntrophobacteraceae bacterium]